MPEYWTHAIALTPSDNKPVKLFTYDSSTCISDCDKIINTWRDDYEYKLLISWVEANYDNGNTGKQIIHKKEYLTNFTTEELHNGKD